MPTEILMPALSPTMEEGTLAKWLVKEGDEVKSGDILAEIETDKATMEFEAVDEGKIGKILVQEGTAGVKVNTAIAVLLEDGESADDIGAAKAAPKAQAKAEDAPEADAKPDAKADAPKAAPKPADGNRVFASPLARRLAAEKGIDLADVTGSGPHGRIVKADLDGAKPAAAKPAAAAAESPKASAPAAAAAPVGPSADAIRKIYADRETTEVALDGMRRTIAARLSEAKQTIPHFYLRRSAKLDALMEFRATLNKQLEQRGVKLSVNDFIIKACALALQEVPDANAVWAGDRILKLKPSDVAVAVAIEGGLFTPVLKDAQQKTLSALSAEMKDLATRAKSKKLAPHEYQGGSFAISNLGMFGIENFDAVINPPHGAILAVGAGIQTPVVEKGEVVVRNVMSMTLSVDHRVIDGALGAQLLEKIVAHLENPMGMLA
ncbi:pyruvate dehydrogenase complex dihydrolipoamide acetyltransferase [Paracoccus shanxieyensis]|uniref:Acetyltransferase component of pyruvate dehydrogenase complex n=1 Tax=Paracoccus shanxieyensis TaxID=2675752 RepID=A0A6L6J0C6_9RHOB|nr:pyruvate dehydrogenase complex dihydrolipoamide acetyltransferase [Paracoccus shanxieyensis]MTH64690.1 pyruvate dehydrogenase complex dihydrolipoamide acetyltransferase [Paracoccus shanxieyensis]MTH87834.1 pyruvate dehydrogenase complex dihydrolipoamide acetyltransferase [Paracoccus shanxieyensis]